MRYVSVVICYTFVESKWNQIFIHGRKGLGLCVTHW